MATGDTPIMWSVEAGSLPNGLSLSTAGVISGTPTTADTFNFTVKAINAAGNNTKALSIVIGASGGTGTAPTITTATLPNGTVGTAYSQTLTATGDTPITWSIETGSLPSGLPPGLSLSTAGVISGTPTTADTFNFTVKATNATGNDTKALSIVINNILPFNDADGAANIGRTGPGGGKIFYYNAAGFTLYQTATDTVGITAHYLEAAPADMSTTLAWASSSAYIPPSNWVDIIGTGTAIGTGRRNTALILAKDANAPAAKACNDLTTGGKTDWFLPSKDELNELYAQRNLTGINITTGWYWSSSQNGSDLAWGQSFSDGLQGYSSKVNTLSVRAVRAF